MDWPVVAGDFFLVTALTALLLAPLVGAGVWHRHGRAMVIGVGTLFVLTFGLLAINWRHIPGGLAAAASANAALLVALMALVQLGRVIRGAVRERLLAGLAGLLVSIALTVGPFALGPLMNDVPLTASRMLLAANPLVTVAAAAGIDFLHLDLIYRLSPLAHRGVALPAWTTVCSVYAVLGLAGYGVSHLRYRSA